MEESGFIFCCDEDSGIKKIFCGVRDWLLFNTGRRHMILNFFSASSSSFCARIKPGSSSARALQGTYVHFPIDESPANFLVIRIGSHLSSSERYTRSVVEEFGFRLRYPLRKSRMISFAYTSSWGSHFPFRRRSDFALICGKLNGMLMRISGLPGRIKPDIASLGPSLSLASSILKFDFQLLIGWNFEVFP